jgi:hypothetical protein
MIGADALTTDLAAWADSFHLSFPVMFDDWTLATEWAIPGTPIQHLIGPGSEIIDLNTRFSEDYLEELLDI